MSDMQTYPGLKVTHNTVALEEAILSSVKAASAPAYRAIAEAQFLRAKALLLKICAICLLVICIGFAVIFVWQAVSKSSKQTVLVTKTEVPAVEDKSNPAIVPISQKEKELREILKTQISNEPSVTTKGSRENSSSSKITRDLLNPSSSIGSLANVISENTLSGTETRAEPVIIENMVVGPEVQTLTVFKERNIKLANGLNVQIVAGHQFANNSSTQKWRQGYCYVTWTDELSIRVNLATKPGKEASVVNGYILPNELEMLGGIREVDKLRNLCPWMQ
jgi:hypothetical protein